MRRIALSVAVATLLALVAAAGPSADPAGAKDPFTLTTTAPGPGVVMFPGGPKKAGRTVGYWGKFTGVETGSYRATCVWLADPTWPSSTTHKQDNRFDCNIVLSFRGSGGNTDGGGLVLQGLVKRPPANHVLFDYASPRQLAITGGTGDYQGAQGWADIQTAGKIRLSFDDLVV
jgi:hypothetical protein